MVLPYSPRTTFDVTVNLNSTSTRAFEGSTYAGKHIRVIPKTVLDTDKGLLFNAAASVTIIGGHFRPSTRTTWAAGNNADGTFVFFNCGSFYMEGVHIDNVNVGNLDAVQCSAISALTTCTIQNCRFDNVQGLESGLHGDIFQTGSTNMGKTGPVRIHQVSGNCNYQGMFLDPQNSGERGGGLTSVALSNVNITRNGTTTNRLYFFYATATRYDSDGYPITISNCWANPGSGQLVERDAVWPANFAGSTNQFPTTKHRAVRSTDSAGAFAHWPGLTDSGKVLSGKIYEGVPPGGDFVPANKVGLNYVQGTDFTEAPPAVGNGGTGGLLSDTWIKSGPGTVTNSPGRLSIISDGNTYTSAAQSVDVRPGNPYRLTFTGQERTFAHKIGKSQEGVEYRALGGGVLGSNSFTFTPDTNSVWIQFQRLSANTATAIDLRFVDLTPPSGTSRSLNGTNQFFTMDNQTEGFPMANSNFYVGAWWNLSSIPASGGLYFYDFGRMDGNLGDFRIRLAYDIANDKLMASSHAPGSGSYRERYFTGTGISVGTPVYLGIAVRADGDVFPIINSRTTGALVSGTIPPLQTDLGHHLRFGASVRTNTFGYVSGSLWDAIWHTGSVPSDTVLNALAGGQRPHQISGFTPTYHWPMVASSTKDEESITGLATLRQVGSPAAVVAPVEPEPTAFRSPCFII